MRNGRPCVLFVAPAPPPVHGGALAMQYLLEQLRDCQLEVLHVDSKFAAGLDDIGKFAPKTALRIFTYAGQMLRHVWRGGVDLAVLTPTFYFKPFLKDAILIWWSTLVLRRRTVAWLHMDYRAMGYDRLPAPARWLVRVTFRRCAGYVICSPGLRDFMPGWLPADRTVALPNGIPAPIARRSRAEDGLLRILYLSNLEQAKGWQVLLEAARMICREHPKVEFVFHGRPAFGLTEQDVRGSIATDDGSGRIRYLGPVYGEDKWQALADADVFAFPSFHEAFPLSVLEAMAAGLPIVATLVGGVPDAVTQGEGGWIVPPKDACAMRAALEKLITDASMRALMGARNRRRYLENYTVESYGLRWRDWLLSEAGAGR